MLWVGKALVQCVFSMLPFGERLNYATQHLSRAHSNESAVIARANRAIDFLKLVNAQRPIVDNVVYEIGTGWDGLSAILLAACGAKSIRTSDHQYHLRLDQLQFAIRCVHKNISMLSERYGDALTISDQTIALVESAESIDECLGLFRIEYIVTRKTYHIPFPDGSADLVFSNLVLAYLPEDEIPLLSRESARALSEGGLAAHKVRCGDLFSPLRGGNEVAFLSHPEWLWSVLCQNRISYANRLRPFQILKALSAPGLAQRVYEEELLPINVERVSTMKVAKRFESFTASKLAATAAIVVHQKV